MTTAGQHEFASGVKLQGFSALFEAEFTPKVSEDLVFKGRSNGLFRADGQRQNASKLQQLAYLPSRIPFKVEAGQKYKIEIGMLNKTTGKPTSNLISGKK